MKNLKPNLYVIKNGKLQVKERENEPSVRVIPYSRSVRVSESDPTASSLAQYKKEIQFLRKSHCELLNAYQHLQGLSRVTESPCSSTIQLSPFPNSSKDNKENETMLDSRSVYKSVVLDQVESSEPRLKDLSNSICEMWSPMKRSRIYEPDIRERLMEAERRSFEEEKMTILEEMKRLKKELEKAKAKINCEESEMNEFYQKNIKKLEEILERERKHSKLLNGVIARMREEMESKDKILKYVVSSKNVDKQTVLKMAKTMKLKL